MDKLGKQYWIMTLSDISTSIQVYCFNMNSFMVKLQPDTFVHIEAKLSQVSGYQYVRCAFLQLASSNRVTINALASAYSSTPKVLSQFKTLVDSIKSPHLKQFLSNLLVNNEIGIAYLQAPASLRHHHNYPGGLLVHSIDVAHRLLSENKFGDKERDIALVCALIHDIGKTRTLSKNGARTALGMVVDHDELTLEVCGQALQILDAHEPQSSLMLRHILTCATPGARYGYQAITPIALKLQNADKQSAADNDFCASFAQTA